MIDTTTGWFLVVPDQHDKPRLLPVVSWLEPTVDGRVRCVVDLSYGRLGPSMLKVYTEPASADYGAPYDCDGRRRDWAFVWGLAGPGRVAAHREPELRWEQDQALAATFFKQVRRRERAERKLHETASPA